MCDTERQSTQLERLVAVVRAEIDRYAGYHRHKESMAYTGFALFVGATGFVLTSNTWPPPTFADSKITVSVVLLIFWGVLLVYLRFQLHRRRWAALRVAGCEHVLLRWVQNGLDNDCVAPATRPKPAEFKLFAKVVDWFVPQKRAVLVLEESAVPYYPGVLVDAWIEKEATHTAALKHERLVVISGWIMFILCMFRTWG